MSLSVFTRSLIRSINSSVRSSLRPRTFSTTSPAMTVTKPVAASEPFFQAVEARRTYYNLTDKVTVDDAKLQEIVERAVKFVPSSFNTQTSRAVLVIGDKHRQLWDAVFEAHKVNVKPEELPAIRAKFDHAYKAGYATVVFFEDQAAIDAFIKIMPHIAGPLPTFSSNTAGMVQYIVWTALAAEGIAGNLQHFAQFSPANAAAVRTFLDTPESWNCTGLLPIGVPADKAAPGVADFPKTFQPIEDRVKVVA